MLDSIQSPTGFVRLTLGHSLNSTDAPSYPDVRPVRERSRINWTHTPPIFIADISDSSGYMPLNALNCAHGYQGLFW